MKKDDQMPARERLASKLFFGCPLPQYPTAVEFVQPAEGGEQVTRQKVTDRLHPMLDWLDDGMPDEKFDMHEEILSFEQCEVKTGCYPDYLVGAHLAEATLSPDGKFATEDGLVFYLIDEYGNRWKPETRYRVVRRPGAKGSGRPPVILTIVRKDSWRTEVHFDALPWFKRANDRVVQSLVDANFSESASVKLLEWARRKVADVGILLSDKEQNDCTIQVSAEAAVKWLAAERPTIVSRRPSEHSDQKQ